MSGRKRRYHRYLGSKHWKTLRAKALQAARFRCEWCGFPRKLQVHHERYRNLYDCTLGDLAVLCERCHMDYHHPQRVKRRKKKKRRGRRKNYVKRQQRKAMKQRLTLTMDVVLLEQEFERGVNEMFREIRMG